MATFPFLSDEWVSEARKIREEYEGKGAVVPHLMRMNLNVTEVPFGPGGIEAHLDTSEGALKLELATSSWSTSPSLSTTPRPRPSWSRATRRPACRPSWPARIKVDGDMSKLMALQGAPPTPPRSRWQPVCARSPSSDCPVATRPGEKVSSSTGSTAGPLFPELGFYALAGQAHSSRDVIDEVRRAEELGLGSAFISERFDKKEAAVLSGAAGP